jgi:hypothetical protein
MILSTYPLSTYTIGNLPSEYSLATENPFRNLQRGVDIQLTYLIELEPYNTELEQQISGAPLSAIPLSTLPRFARRGGVDVIYLSDKGFFTNPTDTPSNTSYLPLVNNPFQFEVSILNGDEFRGGIPSFGAIRIKNGEGIFDEAANYFWQGRKVTIYAGGANFARSDFEVIFNGAVRDIEYDEDEIIINISDKTAIIEKSFEQQLYLGTGGVEGGENIEGNVKPLCYGEVYNIPLTLVDAGTNLYQAHDGSIEEVLAVYDRGVELNNQGDVADITATTVSGGNFKTQLSGGYIRLGGNPDGTITADVKGDNTGGYIDKTGAIISRLARTKLGQNNLSTNEVDQGGLNLLDTNYPYSIGVYINSKTQFNNVLDQITIPANFYWFFNRTGLLTVKAVSPPSSDVLTINQNQIIDGSFELLRSISPYWRITAGYKKNWQVTLADNLAPATSDAQKSFAIEEFRKLTVEDRATRTVALLDNELTFNSLFVSETDAQAYRDRLVNIYQTKRNVYRLTTFDLLFKVFIGDTIKIKYPRYGLDNGKDFVIVGISEEAEDNQTILEVWG